MCEDELTSQAPRQGRRWLKFSLWAAMAGMAIASLIAPPFAGPGGPPMDLRTVIIFGIRLMMFTLAALCAIVVFPRMWRACPQTPRGWTILGLICLTLSVLTVCLLAANGTINWDDSFSRWFCFFLLISLVVYGHVYLFIVSLPGFLRAVIRHRVLQKVLLAVVVVIGLLMAFRLEENVRGRHAWQRCLADLKAQGESFSPEDFAPPAVPPEQNFALSPVIVSSYAQHMDADGKIIFPPNTNVTNQLEMSLERKNLYRYEARIIGNWRKQQATDLRPWQSYFRQRFMTNESNGLPPPAWVDVAETNGSVFLTALDTNEFPTTPEPQSPAEDVLLALGKFSAAIEAVRLAGERPASRFPYKNSASIDPYYNHSYLDSLPSCGAVLQLRAIAELQNRQPDAALADVCLIFRLADAIKDEPFLYSQFARSLLVDMALQPVWEGLARHQWSASQLETLQPHLAAQHFLPGWCTGLRLDRIDELQTLDQVCTNRPDQSAALFFEWMHLGENTLDMLFYLPEPMARELDEIFRPLYLSRYFEWIGRSVAYLPPPGWYDIEKSKLARVYQAVLRDAVKPEQHAVFPAQLALIATNLPAPSQLPRYDYVRKLYDFSANGPLFQTLNVMAKRQNGVDLALIACGLERYHLQNGSYPATLAELVPKYLPTIPPDVVKGQPLHYQAQGTNTFLLYSIGWNGVDDHGGTNLIFNGTREGDTADWIWPQTMNPSNTGQNINRSSPVGPD